MKTVKWVPQAGHSGEAISKRRAGFGLEQIKAERTDYELIWDTTVDSQKREMLLGIGGHVLIEKNKILI